MLSRVCRNELSSGWLLCKLLNLAVDLVFVAYEVAHGDCLANGQKTTLTILKLSVIHPLLAVYPRDNKRKVVWG
jgi:hypothetical protein